MNTLGKERVFPSKVLCWKLGLDVSFGEGLGQKIQGFNIKIRYGFSYFMVPFPRHPLRFILFIRKLVFFPLLHAPVTFSQLIVGWVWMLIDLGVCYIFLMNMTTLCTWNRIIDNHVSKSLCKCMHVQKCYSECTVN